MVALAFPTYGLPLVGWFHLRLMAFTGFHSQTWMINRTTKNVNLYPYHCSLLVCLLVYMGNFWGTCARKKKKKDLGSIWKLKHLEVLPSLPSQNKLWSGGIWCGGSFWNAPNLLLDVVRTSSKEDVNRGQLIWLLVTGLLKNQYTSRIT